MLWITQFPVSFSGMGEKFRIPRKSRLNRVSATLDAAAIALKTGVDPARVDTGLLRKTLREQGAVICD